MSPRHRPRPTARRGNTIVLVVGVLVLLAIIATSFVTRTHAGRVTATGMQRARVRQDFARDVAEQVAQEISQSLFVRPLDLNDPCLDPNNPPATCVGVADSSFPRLAPVGPRYGIDRRFDNNGTLVLDFGYNYAPYHVVPWTNWPDGDDFLTSQGWPKGAGNPNGNATGAYSYEDNPIGNPGFGDTRWLRDLEPMSWNATGDPSELPDAVLMYRHMTNIARPDNGWRVCRDISDLGNAGVYANYAAGVVENLGLPVEQWTLAFPKRLAGPPLYSAASGSAIVTDDFFERWQLRFNPPPPPNDGVAWSDPNFVPPNVYKLSDLNGDGTVNGPGERPRDEFVRGTWRWQVGRILADADGDGFTDSFWFLAPGSVDRGVRQIAAVSIIDNSAMLDINVGSQFIPGDTGADPAYPERTIGATPMDLALIGQNGTGQPSFTIADNTWNVGFLDNWFANEWILPGLNPYDSGKLQGWLATKWCDLLAARSYDTTGASNPSCMDLRRRQIDRLAYWLAAGRRRWDPLDGYTPFELPCEIELRAFHGSNEPWAVTRLETALDSEFQSNNNRYFLRSRLSAEESGDYLDSLSSLDLWFDNRHLVTTYSGARNDQTPPYLWWENRWRGLPDPNQSDGARRLRLQSRTKLDLREQPVTGDPIQGLQAFESRLGRMLLLALHDGGAGGGSNYFTDDDNLDVTDTEALDRTRRMAAALTANILEYRDPVSQDIGQDPSQELYLDKAPIKLGMQPAVDDVNQNALGQDASTRYLGMERQPFLVEALIAHVYQSVDTVPQMLGSNQYTNAGKNLVCGGPFGSPYGTIVAVQVANPYDREFTSQELQSFRLSVFGSSTAPREINLGASGQPLPARSARTYYAVDDVPGIPADAWVAALGLNGDGGQAVGGHIEAGQSVSGWETQDRTVYNNSSNAEHAVELIRLVRQSESLFLTVPVVVDRIDIESRSDREFGDEVSTLRFPEPCEPITECPPPGVCAWDAGEVLDDPDNYWMVYAHAKREWDVDINSNGSIDPDEINPRYVFADRVVETGETAFTYSGGFGGGAIANLVLPTKFDVTEKDCDTFGFPRHLYSMQMLQKDAPFDQVGELLNVWTFCHEIKTDTAQPPTPPQYIRTAVTFSEFMADEELSGDDTFVGRLRVTPAVVDVDIDNDGPGGNKTVNLGRVIGLDQPWTPDLPAGARVLDLFVCDGAASIDGNAYLNAQAFSGEPTPGLINVNTAPARVLRALPHMTRIVHSNVTSPSTPRPPYPRLGVAEGIVQYRERYDGGQGGQIDGTISGVSAGPDYTDRSMQVLSPGGSPVDLVPDIREDRGFASTAELLNVLATGPMDAYPTPTGWRIQPFAFTIDFAARAPFLACSTPSPAANISTDVVNGPFPNDPVNGDGVAGDSEEANLLFSGMSNLITTRSDVFTAYIKIRSVRQNPITGVWDATDPEFILDDSRYVMLVDRSNVNEPTDQPKILYFEKLPR